MCGSDGVTYTNNCVLECTSKEREARELTSVSRVDSDKCSECVCQDIDMPVCTLGGITYPNECELSCENTRRIRENKSIIYLAYRTACIGPPCTLCTNIAAPVCGTDNVLYRSQCVLDCASANARNGGYPQDISLKNVGACLDGCLCPTKEEPVCGSDGRVYDNLCYLACENRKNLYSTYTDVTVANRNICDNCQCPSVIEPVCGSDGKTEPRTFGNACQMDCIAKRDNNPYLKVIRKGPCPKCFCTEVASPVCGTNHKTYRNECELRCASNNVRSGDNPISIFHVGACQKFQCECSHCSGDYIPLCGSDGRTYWNLCWLKCNNECRTPASQISIVSQGSCTKFD